jgi:quercetin dioxygenase-like cupin family protein
MPRTPRVSGTGLVVAQWPPTSAIHWAPIRPTLPAIQGLPAIVGIRGISGIQGIYGMHEGTPTDMTHWRFDAGVAHPLTAFGNHGVRIAPLVRWEAGAGQAAVFHLESGGEIGGHPAGGPQLLLVVAGSGFVTGSDGEMAVHPGEAVFVGAGEWHRTWTEEGLTAIVLEHPDLDPSRLMVPA